MQRLADARPEPAVDPCDRWPELAGGEVKFRVYPEQGGIVFAVRGPLDPRFAVVAMPIPAALGMAAAIVLEVQKAMIAAAVGHGAPGRPGGPRKIGVVP